MISSGAQTKLNYEINLTCLKTVHVKAYALEHYVQHSQMQNRPRR